MANSFEERRLRLHAILCDILGSRNVYFQPPESIKMKYPAIVYSLDGVRNQNANNSVYAQLLMYQITVIDEDPDSGIMEALSQIPAITFDRSFRSENLNHYTFTLRF